MASDDPAKTPASADTEPLESRRISAERCRGERLATPPSGLEDGTPRAFYGGLPFNRRPDVIPHRREVGSPAEIPEEKTATSHRFDEVPGFTTRIAEGAKTEPA